MNVFQRTVLPYPLLALVGSGPIEFGRVPNPQTFVYFKNQNRGFCFKQNGVSLSTGLNSREKHSNGTSLVIWIIEI